MENAKTIVNELRKRGLSNGTSLGYHSGLMDEAADVIESQQAQIKKLKEALNTAIDCIAECEHACHKVYNSRIEDAVNEWETYAKAQNIDNLLTEMEREN